MKSIFLILLLAFSLKKCPEEKEENPTPVDTTPDYQKAINAKYIALGWDKDGHSKFNNTNPVKTTGGKGWVQYYAYSNRKTAIYYFEGKEAFGMDTEEMVKYDNIGQDNWGMVISDPKPTKSGGCGYNDMVRNDGAEGIITCRNLVDGEVYKKYKELNRWDGPLGFPVASVLLTPANATDKGVFGTFQNGTIWQYPSGTYALWGKVLKMYQTIDYERSWLGKPKESCDPKKGDGNQNVVFEKGKIGIDASGTCGIYYEPSGLPRLQNGSSANIGSIPCY